MYIYINIYYFFRSATCAGQAYKFTLKRTLLKCATHLHSCTAALNGAYQCERNASGAHNLKWQQQRELKSKRSEAHREPTRNQKIRVRKPSPHSIMFEPLLEEEELWNKPWRRHHHFVELAAA